MLSQSTATCPVRFELSQRSSVTTSIIVAPEDELKTEAEKNTGPLQIPTNIVDENEGTISLCLAVGAIISTALGAYIGILFHPMALIVLVVGNSTCIVCSELFIHSRKTFKIKPIVSDCGGNSHNATSQVSEERF